MAMQCCLCVHMVACSGIWTSMPHRCASCVVTSTAAQPYHVAPSLAADNPLPESAEVCILLHALLARVRQHKCTPHHHFCSTTPCKSHCYCCKLPPPFTPGIFTFILPKSYQLVASLPLFAPRARPRSSCSSGGPCPWAQAASALGRAQLPLRVAANTKATVDQARGW